MRKTQKVSKYRGIHKNSFSKLGIILIIGLIFLTIKIKTFLWDSELSLKNRIMDFIAYYTCMYLCYGEVLRFNNKCGYVAFFYMYVHRCLKKLCILN